jgi:proteasome lid subunit RPN8/RPN11
MLPRVFYEEMLAQARAELPNECCGMLAGRIEPGEAGAMSRGLVLRRFPLVNELASPTEYLLESKSWRPALMATEKEHMEVLAFYHSHPVSDPVPSRKDRAGSEYYPQAMHLIISLKEPEPLMRAWWLTPADHSGATFVLTDLEPAQQIDRGRAT